MSYVDLTAEFTYKFFLTYQDMNQLAANDAYDHLAGGTVLSFYQQIAPIGWLKQTTVDDSFVRVVDGAGGGSGGATGLSTLFGAIQHTHTIASHSHAVSAHSHVLDYTASAAGHNSTGTNIVASATGSTNQIMTAAGGASTGIDVANNTESSGSGNLGNTAPVTDSSLTNITFKYADVIVCTKGS